MATSVVAAWRARNGQGPLPSGSVTISGILPPPAASAASPAPSAAFGSDVGEYVKLVVGLGSLYALDMAIKKAFTAASITFPSALGGMFGVVALLLAVGESNASSLLAFYTPALNWIAKWLPLFYVASLVTLPLALKGIAGLLGANFGPNLMSAVGIKDTIARGLAAAGTAGGLGTASLTSKEPEALPFCALSYSLVGILSTFLIAIPAVRQLLMAIVA
ncbi:hypothetical protein GPECTOR_18g188 [Gonium pectorale]|uniref:Uncharacterized protein n=1 Tax=Gonium pectorale TaxID=33097 RepID=A0A150GJQ3_GONPE|nr:hypothetical protein GPECTOR_18g188 [Gonium pectorale]|eukprot:KXZ50036.1 hypothetical protein GPECTOR_18g188 [Gonium pectorale]